MIKNTLLSGVASLSLMYGCGTPAPGDTDPSLYVTKEAGKVVALTEGSRPGAGTLWVNGSSLGAVAEGGKTIVPEANLRPGKNVFLWEVPGSGGSVDSLYDTLYYSYNINYHLLKEYEHDPTHFTQGLFLEKNILFESTGLEGKSGIWKYRLDDHQLLPLDSMRNQADIFGEGIAAIGNDLYQLSWENKKAFVYDKNTLKKKKEFAYPREGWGIASKGDSLVSSDGSENLYFLDPVSLEPVRTLQVRDETGPVKNLNELEWVGPVILANIWQTHVICIIDARNGEVLGKIDLAALYQSASRSAARIDVLNGIAYDPADGSFLVTGKLWPKLYRIQLDDRFRSIVQSGETEK